MYGMLRTESQGRTSPPTYMYSCIRNFIELTNMKYNINHRLLSFLLKVAEGLGVGNPHVAKQGKPGAPLQGVIQRPECKDTTPAFTATTVVFYKIKLVLIQSSCFQHYSAVFLLYCIMYMYRGRGRGYLPILGWGCSVQDLKL